MLIYLFSVQRAPSGQLPKLSGPHQTGISSQEQQVSWKGEKHTDTDTNRMIGSTFPISKTTLSGYALT